VTPTQHAAIAVYDKIGALFPGQAGVNLATEIADAAIRAFITAIAPDPNRPTTAVNPCCGSEIGHYPTCAARA
jgi:hypothetical protein